MICGSQHSKADDNSRSLANYVPETNLLILEENSNVENLLTIHEPRISDGNVEAALHPQPVDLQVNLADLRPTGLLFVPISL